MPIIDVTIVGGTDEQQREKFMEEVTELAVKTFSVPENTVRCIIRDIPTTHFSVAGVPKNRAQ
ncbi:MAG: tautomerase family protein [Oceanospirillaceae bacterium]|nr:tautomerase family protein [Oceanospirillaceae bacterium]